MARAGFVRFEVPKALANAAYEAIATARSSGKLKKGVNEATKAIERGTAKLVVMAEDVTPEEVLMHIPALCEEKQVPYVYVPSKVELGKAAGVEVGTSAIAVTEEGEAKRAVAEIATKVKGLKA